MTDKVNDIRWRKITKSEWDWSLECVPPYKMTSGAFMVGEKYGYDADCMCPTVKVCVQVIDKFYAKIVPMSSWNPMIYTDEIIKQFNIDIYPHTAKYIEEKYNV